MSTPRRAAPAAVLAGLVLSTLASAQHRPAVFADLDYKAARERAVAEKKILIVDAMTSWCGPCKRMDQTTWVDADLVAWIGANAVAVQIDMDQARDLAAALGITAYPTIVAFRDDRPFDRLVGYRDAEAMKSWLVGVAAGKTDLDRAKSELDELRTRDPAAADARERARLAGDLLAYGQYDDALTEYLWLWANARDTRPTAAVRRLVAQHPPARAAFAKLCAPLGEKVAGGGESGQELTDWLELCSALADDEQIVKWAKAAADTDAGRAKLCAQGDRVCALLLDHGAWRAAGFAIGDPLQRVRFLGENLGAYDVERTASAESASTGAASAEPKAVPAIPLKPAPAAPKAEPAAAGQPKTVPAIPLKPAPAAPKAESAPAGQPKAVPAIPLKPAPAAPKAEPAPAAEGKTVPAIPLMTAPGRTGARPTASREEIAADVRARLTHELRQTAARAYAALLAADREADAEAIATELLRHAGDAHSRAALVATALRAGVYERARDRHLRWLDEASW